MLRNKTTFVIGAGASRDYGFPLGDGLRNLIIELLASKGPSNASFADPTVLETLTTRSIQESDQYQWMHRMDLYERAAAVIRRGLPFARSIDSFLDGFRDEPEVEFLGKLAIAIIILQSERKSPLSTNGPEHGPTHRAMKLERLLSAWHIQLGQMLFDGHTRDTIGSVFKDVNFVVFNYDRCIEQFLTIALMRRFNIEQGRARDLVAGCSIVHPYGKVGELREAHSGGVPYGGLEGADFAQVASSIKTYTESMEEQTAGVVKDSVAAAQTLVFMGFGWLGQNVELLDTGHRETKAEKVFATTMGMPPGEVEVVVDRINAIVHRGRYNTSRTELGTLEVGFVNDNGDCGALMRNCWLRLTGG